MTCVPGGGVRTLGCLGAVLLVLAGCGSDGAAVATAGDRHVFTGRLESSDARVAFVVSGGSAVAYVCGGQTTYATMSRWFHPAPGPDGAFHADDGGFTLDATLTAGTLSGTLRSPDGTTRSFATTPAVKGTITGLYGTVDEGCHTGAIVEQDREGAVPFVQGTWCSSAGAAMQVTPAKPALLANGAFAVSVAAPTGKKQLELLPVGAVED